MVTVVGPKYPTPEGGLPYRYGTVHVGHPVHAIHALCRGFIHGGNNHKRNAWDAHASVMHGMQLLNGPMSKADVNHTS